MTREGEAEDRVGGQKTEELKEGGGGGGATCAPGHERVPAARFDCQNLGFRAGCIPPYLTAG